MHTIYGKSFIGSLLFAALFNTSALAGEIGENDFRVSHMGVDGELQFGPFSIGPLMDFRPAVAWNRLDNEYLVVWSSDDQVDQEFEIFGHRLDGTTGQPIGDDFRISHMGPDGNRDFDALNPAVVWNPSKHEYLVVWEGDGAVSGEFEIYGQRIDRAGNEIGGDDFRITHAGVNGDPETDAVKPAIAWNNAQRQYFVIWYGDGNGAFGSRTLVNNEFEIFGRRLNADATLAGPAFLISDMGPDGDARFGAFNPALAWDARDDEYLVVWHGDDNTDFGHGALVNNELEIFGQRIDGATGRQLGTDFRISDMSGDGIAGTQIGDEGALSLSGIDPTVTYNSRTNEYLVVWAGNDTDVAAEGEFEIFGQRLSAKGIEEGVNDFRVSDMGPPTEFVYDARKPAVAYNQTQNEYLVVWDGDTDANYGKGRLAEGEDEIFAQRIIPDGTGVGGNLRLSDMGIDGDAGSDALNPMLVWNPNLQEYLVAWRGTEPPVDSGAEFEIYGQRLKIPATIRFVRNDYQVSEHAGNATVDVQRIGNTSDPVTVDYATGRGSALAPSDYTAVSGTLTFSDPGVNSLAIQVPIIDDSRHEMTETINLVLRNPAPKGTIIDSRATRAVLSIADNDPNPGGGGGGNGGSGDNTGGDSSGGGAIGPLFLLALLVTNTLAIRWRRR